MEDSYFTKIERQFEMVLDALAGQLSPTERSEVVEFIDVGEFGIALETLSSLLIEERKQIPAVAFTQMIELADSMEIRASTITEELRSQVIPE